MEKLQTFEYCEMCQYGDGAGNCTAPKSVYIDNFVCNQFREKQDN